MNMPIATTSIDSLLEHLFGDRAPGFRLVLDQLQGGGTRHICLNLPLHYDTTKESSDLDLLLDNRSYQQARQVLEADGFVVLSGNPDRSQTVLLKWDSTYGFVRIHLHRHFEFLGIRTMSFDEAIPFTIAVDGHLACGPELDYWVCLTEWLFRRKAHYADRLGQLSNHLAQAPNVADSPIRPECRPLLQQAQGARSRGRQPTLVAKLKLLLRYAPNRWSVLRVAIGQGAGQRRQIRGMMVFLMGVDGTGKTTLAGNLSRLSGRGGLAPRTEYLGLKKTWVQRLRRALSSRSVHDELADQTGIAQRIGRHSRLVGQLFNAVVSAAYVIEYRWRMRRVRRYLKTPNTVAIIDRNYYDKLLDRERWGNLWFFRFLPRPDLVVVLTGDPQSLYERKREVPVSFLVERQVRLAETTVWLQKHGVEVAIRDTTVSSKEQTCRFAMEQIWRCFINRMCQNSRS